jgi:hypothetical protein
MRTIARSSPRSVDFRRYVARKNPYAASLARTGIRIRTLAPPAGKLKASPPPSRASLREMPVLDMSSPGKNRFAAGIRAAGVTLPVGPGRPVRGQEVGPTSTRSVRLPASVWRAVEAEAARRGTTVHALLRSVIARVV